MSYKFHTRISPGSLSFAALLFIAISQMFNFNLIRQAHQKEYIDNHSSYQASIDLVEVRPGRSVSRIYRIIYSMRNGDKDVECNVLVDYSKTALPILEKNIRVTPKNGMCNNPYLTDYEYFPLYNALASTISLAFASLLLVSSSYKINKKTKSAIVKNNHA